MMYPTVTVVIPCFNQGQFIRQAVDSCLQQVDADVRVVVVEDGSTDEMTAAACDAVAGDRVRIVHQENRGLPAARNRGAAEAVSEYLVFLDADDWIEPTFVKHLAGAIAESDVGGVVGGVALLGAGAGVRAGRQVGRGRVDGRGGGGAGVVVADPPRISVPASAATAHPLVSHAYCQERLVEKGRGIWQVPEWDPVLMLITNLHPVTALVRRECFEAVGGFEETMTGGYEDWDLWIKFVERGWRGVRVREPLFVWRRHSDDTMIMNVIHNHEALYRGIMERHPEIYERYAGELLVRMNTMMRRFDVNWLDESGEPIRLMALRRQREVYEKMLGVKAQRALRRVVGRMWGKLRGR